MKDWTGNKKSVWAQLAASNHSEKERENNDYVFYDIPSFKGRLKINKKGEVYSLLTNKILKESTLPTGYRTIILMLKNPRRSKTLYVHRLIAETFIPNPENKPQVNHIDGNKQNNCVDNLEWCTQRENNIHALKNGLRKPNVEKIMALNQKRRKLNHEQVIFIKKNQEKTAVKLCEELNLNYKEYWNCVYDVKRGKTYINEK